MLCKPRPFARRYWSHATRVHRADGSCRRVRSRFCSPRARSFIFTGMKYRRASRSTGWSSRTTMGVYAPLLFGALISACMWLTANTLLRSARIVDRTRLVLVHHDFAHRVAQFLLLIEFFLAAVFSCVGLLPLTGTMPVLIVTILMLPAVFILIVWLNKGRMHAGKDSETDLAAAGDGTPDECWKFGMLYFNPDDAALWVEKRVGIGYTMNFAHVSAWVIVALLLLLPLTLGLLTLHHR